jgi:hypothetical protein
LGSERKGKATGAQGKASSTAARCAGSSMIVKLCERAYAEPRRNLKQLFADAP